MPIPDDEIYTVSFGYWVKRRRVALDLTQATLARRVGCAAVTIKKIEGDERRPSRQMAERLAAELGLPEADRARFVAMGLGQRAADAMTLSREPLDVALDGTPPWLSARQGAPVSEPLFVGREQELAQLHAHLQSALDGSGRVVLVAGEAGRGKTALLSEFAHAAQSAEPDLVVAQGACSSIAGFGDPYLPFRELLTCLTGDLDSCWQAGRLPEEQVRRLWALAPAAAGLVLEVGPQLVDVLVPAGGLRRRLAAPEQVRLREIERQNGLRRDRLFEQTAAVLAGLARKKPLLLLIDDLQWADTASTGLLFHLSRRLPASRILLVCAYRPSEVDMHTRDAPRSDTQQMLHETLLELGRHFGEIEIDLDSFEPAAARRLTDALLDREPNRLSEPFRHKFFWHTRGHPLFALELLREMQARGSLSHDATGHWVESGVIDWDALPTRVAVLIKQRLDRLDREVRRVLEVASVEGEHFTAACVASSGGMDEAHLLRVLARELGQRYSLVCERGELAVGGRHLARFQFRHVLFQQYLYQALGEGERRRLHAGVAASLEALYGADLEPVIAELAHHYAHAGDATRAVEFLLRAGDRARALYAHQEAVEHYRRALELQEIRHDREGAARTQMKLGLAYHTAFDYQRAREAYQEGFALWQQTEALTRTATARLDRRQALRLNWNTPSTVDPTLAPGLFSNGLLSQLFSGIVALTPGLDVVPELAERWDVTGEGHTYTFFLRRDALWSDGEPITARDVEYAWKRALHPDMRSPLAGWLLRDVCGAAAWRAGSGGGEEPAVVAVDDHTLVVELAQPAGYFPQLVAFPALFPVPRHVVEQDPAGWASGRSLVSNGPFTLAAREADRMRLVRNPVWHGRSTGNVGQVELILDAGPDTLWRMYDAGELDVLNLWLMPPEMVDSARRYYDREYRSSPQLSTHYMLFNSHVPPFDDVRVRRALALGGDRQHLAEVALDGAFAPASGGFVPPGMPGHLSGAGLAPNVERARELLAEAGFPKGRGFPSVECSMVSGLAHLVEPLFAQWRRSLGIDLRAHEVSRASFQGGAGSGRWALLFSFWIPQYPDPDCYLRLCIEADAQDSGWWPAAYARIVERARQLTNQLERLALYRQAEEMLVQEVPILPILYGRQHLLLKPWVRSFQPSPINQQFWHDTVIEPV